MKLLRYIPLAGLLLSTAAVCVSCQDDFDDKIPAFEQPVASHQANMTILELKTQHWREGTNDTDLNYCDTIGFLPGTEDTHIYISGRVISSDEDGNIFKSLVIQDETAALAISINQYDLYLQYRVGQEIVIDCTGMYIGKYRGLMQLGLPSYNETRGYMETSFMPVEFFRMHAERNGFPEPSKIDTITFDNFDNFTSTTNPEVLIKYQSQLVRFNNVYFPDANGTEVFSTYKSNGVDRYIVDANGNATVLPVRTSGYSTFWNNPLPQGNGDVVGILSFYQSNSSNGTFQLLLNDIEGCMNFGNPTVPKGSDIDHAYSIDDVIEMENAGTAGSGWVTGYIVGAVGPEVENQITSSDDIEWTADVTLANTLVISYAPGVKDIAACLVVSLPQGSSLRQYGNLLDNPSNFGKQIWLKGTFEKYMGAWGVTTTGAADVYKIEGVEQPGNNPDTGEGDGTEANPYTLAQALQIYSNGGSTDPVWIECYIVGSVKSGSMSYDDVIFGTTDAATTNIVVGPSASAASASQCMPVQLPSGDVRTALNLNANPSNLGRHVALYGTIEKYFSTGGIKSVTQYKWLDEVNPDPDPDPDPTPDGLGTEDAPLTVTQFIAAYAAGSTGASWVEGYIVGTVPSQYYSDAEFGTANASNTNFLLAPTADTTDSSACIPVQLPSGDIRTALSLSANPSNLGKRVKLSGSMEKYFGVAGLKSTATYTFY